MSTVVPGVRVVLDSFCMVSRGFFALGQTRMTGSRPRKPLFA
jgi:hypothetical protein